MTYTALKKKLSSILYPLSSVLRRGQSLMEVLVAMVIGTIMIVAAITVVVPVLKSGAVANRSTVAALGKGLLENVRVTAEADWHTVSALTVGSANHYHLTTSTSPFSAVVGDEAVTLASTTYTRYFYVENVGRDADSKIVASGGTNDPSTKRLVVVYVWPVGVVNAMTTYLTRSRTRVYQQTDWSGGGGAVGPATTTDNRFDSSSNVNFTSSTGSIVISL